MRDRHDDLLKSGHVLAVAHALVVPADVDIFAEPRAGAAVFRPAVGGHGVVGLAGVELAVAVDVQGDVEDVGVVVEHVLDAVAVVDVPVEDEDLAAEFRVVGLADLGRDRHVVEEAEAHGCVVLGVVAGRADDGEGVLDGARDDALARLDGAAGRDERGLVRHAAHVDRVAALVHPQRELAELLRVLPGQGLDPHEMRRVVDGADLLLGGLAGGDPPHVLGRLFLDDADELGVGAREDEAVLLEHFHDVLDARGVLGVVWVRPEVCVGVELHAIIVTAPRGQ